MRVVTLTSFFAAFSSSALVSKAASHFPSFCRISRFFGQKQETRLILENYIKTRPEKQKKKTVRDSEENKHRTHIFNFKLKPFTLVTLLTQHFWFVVI